MLHLRSEVRLSRLDQIIELLAAHELSPRLRLHGHFRADGFGLPESP
jgi:hypothetical protein